MYRIDGEPPTAETNEAYDGYIEFRSYNDLVHQIETTKGSILVCFFHDRNITNLTHADLFALDATTFWMLRPIHRILVTYRIPSPSRMVGAKHSLHSILNSISARLTRLENQTYLSGREILRDI